MNFIEFLRETLLSLSIAILLPITVYWGILVFFPEPKIEAFVQENTTPEVRSTQLDAWQKAKIPGEKAMFFTMLFVGLAAILIGSLVHINSLGSGLIGGGIINIFFALAHNHNIAKLNFILFLFALLSIIGLLIFKSRK
jgi:hypothetical protein